jgi:hypothetical protein
MAGMVKLEIVVLVEDDEIPPGYISANDIASIENPSGYLGVENP